MRTKSLFDYDHEGTKNNKNDMFNYTQAYTKEYSYPESVSFFDKNWYSDGFPKLDFSYEENIIFETLKMAQTVSKILKRFILKVFLFRR